MNGYTFESGTHTMTAEHEAWLNSRRACWYCDHISEPIAKNVYSCPQHGEWNEVAR